MDQKSGWNQKKIMNQKWIKKKNGSWNKKEHIKEWIEQKNIYKIEILIENAVHTVYKNKIRNAKIKSW